MSAKRLMKEYSNIQKDLGTKDEYSGIVLLEPIEDLYHWRSKVRGPVSSPFEGGVWDLEISLKNDYPISPPQIKFTTKMCHPNVNFKTGEICLDILQAKWSPAWTLASTIIAITLLMSDPEPNSPLNIDVSNLLKNGDLKAYNGLIRYYTYKYALQKS